MSVARWMRRASALVVLLFLIVFVDGSAQDKPPVTPLGASGGPAPLAPPCEWDCIWITPDGGSVTHPPTTSGVQYTFNVYNASEVDDFVAFSCQVAGAVTGCSPSPR